MLGYKGIWKTHGWKTQTWKKQNRDKDSESKSRGEKTKGEKHRRKGDKQKKNHKDTDKAIQREPWDNLTRTDGNPVEEKATQWNKTLGWSCVFGVAGYWPAKGYSMIVHLGPNVLRLYNNRGFETKNRKFTKFGKNEWWLGLLSEKNTRSQSVKTGVIKQ